MPDSEETRLAHCSSLLQGEITRSSFHLMSNLSPTSKRELATQIHSVFSLFLSAQPHNDASNESENGERSPPHLADTEYPGAGFPPPLLLVSSDKSSPA